MHPEYAVFVEGDDELAEKYTAVMAVTLSSIKQYYDEKYDRGNFIKNVILDNILPGDIYLKARELRFNNDVSRVVILIRITEHVDVSVFDIIQNLFPDKNKDFVINLNETDIALIKEVKPSTDPKDLENWRVRLRTASARNSIRMCLSVSARPSRGLKTWHVRSARRRSLWKSARCLIRKNDCQL